MGTPIINFRVAPEKKRVWEEAAQERGVTLTAFMIDSIDDAVAGNDAPAKGKAAAKAKPAGRGSSTRSPGSERSCSRAHFHRSGAFCKTCGETPA